MDSDLRKLKVFVNPAKNYQLSTINYQLSTINYQLFNDYQKILPNDFRAGFGV